MKILQNRLTIFCLLIALTALVGCKKSPLDPYAPYRAGLVSAAQGDIDALPMLPHYDIALQIDTEQAVVNGRERIRFTNTTGAELIEIYLRLYPNLEQYGGKARIYNVMVGEQATEAYHLAEASAVQIRLPEPLPASESVDVNLDFTAVYPVFNDAADNDDYHLFGYARDVLSLVNVYPQLAVYDGGVWQLDIAPTYSDATYSEAAWYHVVMTTPASMIVASTCFTHTITDNADDMRAWECWAGPVRDFAVVMSDQYRVASSTMLSTTVNSYYLPRHEAGGRAALSYGAAALGIYNDRIAPYPYSEFDVVEAPMGIRAMEYPGLVMIGDKLYTGESEGLELRVAHEVAHQWWYGMVGNDQVKEPWLDEGLVEYTSMLYYEIMHGRGAAEQLIARRLRAPYQYLVDNNLDMQVSQPAQAFGNYYEAIVYAKAALFFDAVRAEVGDDTYWAILQRYLNDYKYRVVKPGDFMRVAQEVSGQDLTALYDEWILQ